MENDGLGYSLILDSISIGNMVSRNSIEEISINPIPYRFLTSIKFTKTDILNELKGKLITSLAIHNNIGFYQVELEQVNNDSIIYLSQSYNPGWIAFTNGKILDHVLVNDWANGWKIDGQTSKVTIIFWPQYLEFLGFALLAITFLSILLIKENMNNLSHLQIRNPKDDETPIESGTQIFASLLPLISHFGKDGFFIQNLRI